MDFTDFNMSFNNFTILLAIVTGIIILFLSSCIWIYKHNKEISIIKKNYPLEKIEYYFFPGKFVISFAQFCVGGFIGGFILPFFLFDNVTKIKMVTTTTLPIYIIIALYGLLFALFIGCYCIILTNKRIIAKYPFNIQSFNILLNDIKEIKNIYCGIEIITNNNLRLPIGPHKEAFYLNSKISKIIQEGGNNNW